LNLREIKRMPVQADKSRSKKPQNRMPEVSQTKIETERRITCRILNLTIKTRRKTTTITKRTNAVKRGLYRVYRALFSGEIVTAELPVNGEYFADKPDSDKR
ncbi:hypothetical protein MOC90_09720, partial [Bacillus spizizenii]|nr:hypothetical protein [Bacillus spizizenii]